MGARVDPEQLAHEAAALYQARLRSLLEPQHDGEFVVINLDTGEYEVDADDLAASRRALARFGSARLFTLRVGRTTAYRIGAGSVRPA